MDQIILQNILPDVFRDEPNIKSDIWLQNIVFKRGHQYLIEAESGTGKSSLCSYIYGYRNDYSGIIYFDDKDITTIKNKQWDLARNKELSLLFQELLLFPELTSLENILLKNNMTGYKTENQIIDMFEVLGIDSKLHTKIDQMSWGQRQRVALIRGMCQPFSFFILDEPISHLDDENAMLMAKLVQEETQAQGAGLIVTSIGKKLPIEYDKTYSL